MFTSSVCLGTIAGIQLSAKNQSEEISPVQLVWARVDDVAASNVADTAVALKNVSASHPRSTLCAQQRCETR